MNLLLKQRSFLLVKVFEITESSLKVKISKPFNYVEDEFTFEEVGVKITRKKSPNLYTSIATLFVFLCFSISVFSHFTDKKGSTFADMLFYFIPLLMFLILSYFKYQNEIRLALSNNRYLAFYANSPNNEEVTKFLATIKEKQKEFLLNRYAKVSSLVTAEQLSNNLQWLWDRRIINDAELEHLKSSLFRKLSDESSVGFKFNPKDN